MYKSKTGMQRCRSINSTQQILERHGKTHIFKVDAGVMHVRGFKFYCEDNGVWLTDHVPPEFLA
jgi:putative RNA 2'-phosphotransferase